MTTQAVAVEVEATLAVAAEVEYIETQAMSLAKAACEKVMKEPKVLSPRRYFSDESLRRRGRDVDIPWRRVAATFPFDRVRRAPQVQEEIKKQLMELVKKDPAAALKMATALLKK